MYSILLVVLSTQQAADGGVLAEIGHCGQHYSSQLCTSNAVTGAWYAAW